MPFAVLDASKDFYTSDGLWYFDVLFWNLQVVPEKCWNSFAKFKISCDSDFAFWRFPRREASSLKLAVLLKVKGFRTPGKHIVQHLNTAPSFLLLSQFGGDQYFCSQWSVDFVYNKIDSPCGVASASKGWSLWQKKARLKARWTSSFLWKHVSKLSGYF